MRTMVSVVLSVGALFFHGVSRGRTQQEPHYLGRALSAWVEDLGSDDQRVQRAAVDALARFGRPALRPLVAALDSRDSLVRLNACKALGQMGERAVDAVPALRHLLDDEYDDVSQQAATAIERIAAHSQAVNTAVEETSICSRVISEHVPYLLEDHRLPTESDLIGDWETTQTGTGSDPLCAEGDFNGDGVTDYAAILLHRVPETPGFALFAIVSEKQSGISTYVSFPLHGDLGGRLKETVAMTARPGASLIDHCGSIIPAGEGWIEAQPPGPKADFFQCLVEPYYASARRYYVTMPGNPTALDYVLPRYRQVGCRNPNTPGPERLSFHWNRGSTWSFVRWPICRER